MITDLEALPAGSVVLSLRGVAYQKSVGGSWFASGEMMEAIPEEVLGGMVAYRPGAEAAEDRLSELLDILTDGTLTLPTYDVQTMLTEIGKHFGTRVAAATAEMVARAIAQQAAGLAESQRRSGVLADADPVDIYLHAAQIAREVGGEHDG